MKRAEIILGVVGLLALCVASGCEPPEEEYVNEAQQQERPEEEPTDPSQERPERDPNAWDERDYGPRPDDGEVEAPTAPMEPPQQGCVGVPEGAVILDPATSEGYEVYSRVSAQRGAQALHVLGVYETRSDHRGGYHPEGEAQVEFALPGSNVLALSSYEPTHWQINVAPGAGLERVLVFGYHGQRVTAPEGVEVELHSVEEGAALEGYCGYSLPYNGGGCDTDALLAQIEGVAGLPVTSFHGTYRATQFALRGEGCEAPQPPSRVIQDCQGESWAARGERQGGPALYLGAVYETRGDHSGGFHPEGEARVRFAEPGASVLALSSYEPTHWIVEASPEAELLRVVVFGYHGQRVTAPEGVEVEIHSFEEGAALAGYCGYSLPYNGGGCDTEALIAEVERVTGLALRQFDGCYRANTFVYGGR